MSCLINLKSPSSQIGEAVITSDRGENILFWNEPAKRIFGYQVISEHFRERHSKSYFHTMETGKTKYGNSLLRVPHFIRMRDQFQLPF